MVIDALLNVGGKLIDRLWPDPKERDAAKLELFKLQQSGELQVLAGQLEINKVEAGHPSVFVSGWRPGAGWVCVSGFGLAFVVAPIATWVASLLGKPIVFPTIDTATLLAMLGGMLGLGGLRTFEKINDVTRK